MKYESILLRGLFVVCMVLCVATVGSMLFTPSARSTAMVNETQLTGAQAHGSAITPIACPLLADGVLCVRQD